MPAVSRKPDIAEDLIHRWLRKNYSIDGQLDPLPGECDLNFKLGTEQGDTFVCKISDAHGDLELLAAQNEVMALLNQRGLDTTPKVLVSNRGESIVPLERTDADNARALVGRVLSFVPGKTLAKSAPYSAPLIRDLGRTVGRLNKALADYDHAAFHHRIDWDLTHAMEVVERHRDLVSDSEVRDAVDRIHRDFAEIVAPRTDRLRKSVIHNDANDHNILAEGNRVTGIIDFGDMVHTHTISDLAIAMAYASLGANDILLVIREMAVGYTEFMPIDDAELAVLFPMMRMRLAVSSCMAAHQMRMRPDDPYLAVSQQPIRKTMPKLLALGVDDVHDLLRETLR